MEQDLFGGDSSPSAEEEEEGEEGSSEEEESSGEEENEEQVEGGGGEGGGEGGSVAEKSDSSSSSTGSDSEGEDSGQEEEGEAERQDEGEGEEGKGEEGKGEEKDKQHVATNIQQLFGEGSSSSSSGSDSDEEGSVGGEGGGEEGDGVRSEEGGGGEEGEGVRSEEGRGGGRRNKQLEDSSMEEDEGEPTANGTGSAGLEDGMAEVEGGLSQTVEGLFGDAVDLSSSEEEGEGVMGEEGMESVVTGVEGEGKGEEEGPGEIPRINVEIPSCVADLGSEQNFVKLPNFLSVETRPFDPVLYEDEVEDESEILDEEGRARLKLKVENTIRWRYAHDETGSEVRESNARIVYWSDGSMSLYLGSEIFDIYRQSLQGEHSHLFVRQGTGLQGQGVFHSKLTFRPHSTDSQTHRKMTLSIADRFSKTQKIRVLPAVGKDPESMKREKIKKEEEKLRAAVRRENQQRRVRERHSQKGLTAGYLEPDREDDDGFSLSAIKSSVRSNLSEGRARMGGGGGGEESEGESSEEEGAERLMRAKVADEMESRPLPRKHHMDPPPEAESSRKRQPRRKLLSSDEESSD